MFLNREQAGEELALKLQSYKNKEVVVLAIPRGGLPLGYIIAKALNAPLDVAITKKLGHPNNPEYAVGALSSHGYFLNPEAQVPEEYLKEEIERVRALVEKSNKQYYSITKPHDLTGKWVIIVDDGIATGSTMMATVQLVKKADPKGIVVATPVAPPRTIEMFNSSPLVDEVIYLEAPIYFSGVGQFYEDFSAVPDHEAIRLLEKANSTEG